MRRDPFAPIQNLTSVVRDISRAFITETRIVACAHCCVCTLKSRYIPPFTSIRLADKYVQANASCKHASAHPLIIFCTWNFSAPLQFTWRQNEFSYFSVSIYIRVCAAWSTHVRFSIYRISYIFVR